MRHLFFVILFAILAVYEISPFEPDDSFPFCDTEFLTLVSIPAPEPLTILRGEENAPENIFYKFIRNHPSYGFMYTLYVLNDEEGKNVRMLFMIPLQGDDAIMLIYNIKERVIFQVSLDYHPHWICLPDAHMLFMPKYRSRIELSYLEYLYFFLVRITYDYNYKMISKDSAIQIMDNLFDHDWYVQIDDFGRDAPYFIRSGD